MATGALRARPSTTRLLLLVRPLRLLKSLRYTRLFLVSVVISQRSDVYVTAGVIGPLYLNMINGTRTILKNLPHYFPEFADRTEFDFVGFGWFLGWNDGCDGNAVAECVKANHSIRACTRHDAPLNGCLRLPAYCRYESNMVNMIKDVRKEFGNPKMAVSIPVSGFDGWDQTSPRRLGIIQAQFVRG